jgi:hypothetical protein
MLLSHGLVKMQKVKLFLLVGFTLTSLSIQAKEWHFDVYLGDRKIGTHTFDLNEGMLKSKANFKVKVLFINAYQYDHSAIEQWQDDCLTGLTAHTKEDDKIYDVTGRKDANHFNVTYQEKTQHLPECTMTFAYWNPKILTQKQLLNPQNAEYLDTEIKKIGNETIDVKGHPTMTTHYKIFGFLNNKNKLKIDVWYDQQQNWVELKSITPENYEIIYKLK